MKHLGIAAAVLFIAEGLDRQRKELRRIDPPPVLYHFTDAAGLVGIMTSHVLRVSSVMALSDRSEVVYAMNLARAVAMNASIGDESFCKRLQDCLRPGHRFGTPPDDVEILTTGVKPASYVASLCARED